VATKRCPFCHELIDLGEFGAHCAEHQQLRPDGQQNEYVTLPPEEREQGDLEGVPQVYRHWRCGRCTGMPEEIIRTYLKNPFTGQHVPCRELVWVETGENMQDYNNRLRAAYRERNPNPAARFLLRLLMLFTSRR
jgi:hypothetical protein